MPNLEPIHKGILLGHVALGVGVWLVGVVSVADADGWAGLARAAITLLVAAYLAGVVIGWLLMRYAVGHRIGRIAVALVTPVLAVLAVLLAVRSG